MIWSFVGLFVLGYVVFQDFGIAFLAGVIGILAAGIGEASV